VRPPRRLPRSCQQIDLRLLDPSCAASLLSTSSRAFSLAHGSPCRGRRRPSSSRPACIGLDPTMKSTGATDRRIYAGIGARRTPGDVLRIMEGLACRLGAAGWTLRSGGALGADQAFEKGATRVGGQCETFRTDGGWSARGDLTPNGPSPRAYDLAQAFHPAWSRCSSRAQALHARNSHEVLGADLDTPVLFLVCWTPDGSLDGSSRSSGGTGQALRLASAYCIPVFNLQLPEHRQRIQRSL
jgi:hypothetical protein